MSSLFIHPEIIQAEVEDRRARLTRDWQPHPRRVRGAHRVHLTVHLPVRARRHA